MALSKLKLPLLLKSKLLQHSSVYVVGNILNAVIPFLLLPILIRELGTTEYGKVGIFLSSMGVFNVILGVAGIGYVRARFFKSSKEEFQQILGAILMIFGASCAFFGLTLFVANSLNFAFLGIPSSILTAAFFAGGCQFLFGLRLVILQMQEKPGNYAIVMILTTLANFGLSLFLILYVELRWEGRALGIALPLLISGGGACLFMYTNSQIVFNKALSQVKDALLYNLPLVPHSLAATVLIFCERAAIGKNLSADLVGVYFAAFQVAAPMIIISNSINLALKPWSYRKMAGDDQVSIINANYSVMATLCLIAISYIIFLEYSYELILGEGTIAGKIPSFLLIISGTLTGFYLIAARGLMFANKSGLLMFISVPLAIFFCLAVFAANSLIQVATLNLIYNFSLFCLVAYFGNRVYPQPWFYWLKRNAK